MKLNSIPQSQLPYFKFSVAPCSWCLFALEGENIEYFQRHGKDKWTVMERHAGAKKEIQRDRQRERKKRDEVRRQREQQRKRKEKETIKRE